MASSKDVQPHATPPAEWIERHFDPVDAQALQDPYPVYQHLRDVCPVAHSDAHENGFWILSRYEDVRMAFRDPDLFESGPSISIPALRTRSRLIPLELNPPEHGKFRRLLNPFFSPAAVDRLEARNRDITAQLTRELPRNEPFDFLKRFAYRQPVMAIWSAGLLGDLIPIPGEQDPVETFQAWVHDLKHDPVRSPAAAENIYGYLSDTIEDRRRRPQNDIPSFLVLADIDGRPLTDDEVLHILFLLFMGGVETPAGTLANMFLFLATHNTETERLRRHPDLIDSAIDEIIRAHGPSQAVRRTLRKDVELHGQSLKTGDPVLLLPNAADRDPREFPNPDSIIIDRFPNRHLGFGMGIHRCIGSHLGKLQVRAAVEETLRELPNPRLPEGAELTYSAGLNRSLKTLPLVYQREG